MLLYILYMPNNAVLHVNEAMCNAFVFLKYQSIMVSDQYLSIFHKLKISSFSWVGSENVFTSHGFTILETFHY